MQKCCAPPLTTSHKSSMVTNTQFNFQLWPGISVPIMTRWWCPCISVLWELTYKAFEGRLFSSKSSSIVETDTREFPEGRKENKVLPDQASFRQIFDFLHNKQTEKNELVTVPGTIQERSSMKTQSIQAKNWNWKKRVECWLLKTEWTQFRRGSPFDSKKTWEKRHNKN